LTKRSSHQQFYLDARELKSTLGHAKQSNDARAVARRELGELRSAVSVEQAWKKVFPWRAALELGGFVARQETRKAVTTAPESHPTHPTRARKQGANERAEFFTVAFYGSRKVLLQNRAILRNASQMVDCRDA
jgi:hypothetical protein